MLFTNHADAAGQAARPPRRQPGAGATVPVEVLIKAADAVLPGTLAIPGGATGLVLFAHDNGGTRHSPRNQSVAAALNQAGLGTLLADLLTPEEELNRDFVFNIPLLAARLAGVTGWLNGQPGTARLHVGYFGANTGAAAALRAAADPRLGIGAVVSCGGRPDLVSGYLVAVRAPTLLIAGGADQIVLDLNRRAQRLLACANRLAVVPGATHLFEEPGALAKVAGLAADWFTRYLGQPGDVGAMAG